MIYLFTWNDDFLIKEKVFEWKKLFIQKNGDFDLIHFNDIVNISDSEILSILTWTSLFDNKKLIIIDDLPMSSSNKDKNLIKKQDFLLWLLEQIPNNNIVVFSSCNPDKRSKFYKKLIGIAEIKNFNIKNDFDLLNIISKKYPWLISPSAITMLIKYKSWNLYKILSEIDKLLICYNSIEEKDIIEKIIPELEESIFQIIDYILNKNINKAIEGVNIILNNTIIYAFYNNLLANLRTTIYILKLKNMWINNVKIWEILNLWNRAFLINKSYKIWYKELSNLYINLINLDKKMKSWKLIWTENKDFQYELEKVLINY